MVIALQNTYLSSDLVSPVSYQAGQELQTTLTFIAPTVGKYYLMGALYTSNLEYISGTLFGVLLPEGSDYAVNSAEYTSIWELVEGEGRNLPCKFTFNRSNVVLGLFLMEMAGEKPSLDDDEQVGALSVQLTSPAPQQTLASIFCLAMFGTMASFVMHATLKEK